MPRFGRLGSHCRLGVNDWESPEGGVTEVYDNGTVPFFFSQDLAHE